MDIFLRHLGLLMTMAGVALAWKKLAAVSKAAQVSIKQRAGKDGSASLAILTSARGATNGHKTRTRKTNCYLH